MSEPKGIPEKWKERKQKLERSHAAFPVGSGMRKRTRGVIPPGVPDYAILFSCLFIFQPAVVRAGSWTMFELVEAFSI